MTAGSMANCGRQADTLLQAIVRAEQAAMQHEMAKCSVDAAM